MSNYLAVATVTATLRDLVQETVGATVAGATVTTQRPDSVKGNGLNNPMINIFMYMVAPNPAWRNTDITIHPFDSNKVDIRRQMPLNLFYLVSFYGNDLVFEPQRMLGSVVSAIHARPRLSAQAIQATVARENYLKNSDLDNQVAYVESVTLTPISLSLEELSKLWTIFFQVPYALSVAYRASTVLIEPDADPRQVRIIKEVHTTLPSDQGNL